MKKPVDPVFVYFWHEGMDLDNMCGSNLFVRTSSFIFLNSFVEKTRLSPPGGGVIEDSWVGGWAWACAQRGESPF